MTAQSRAELRWLAAIVALAVGARLAYLYWELHAPGFQWSDPDGYLRQAAALTQSGEWRWTTRAIEYVWGGRTWLLPPGYPVFLSIFYGASSPGPLAAAIAQAVLGGCAAAAIFVIGRSLHTSRTGLIAAFIWAIWFPSVAGRETFVQEQLYLPLLWSSFAALAWCLSTSASRAGFFATGLVFGIAALTRAMPLFYLVVVVPLLWWFRRRQEGPGRWALAFLGGFALVVLPYIVWLSLSVGHLVLIDDHMMIVQTDVHGRSSVAAAVSAAVAGFVNQLEAKVALGRGLFQVYGLSWLYHYGNAASADGARWLGLLVHVTLDTLFVAAALLAPAGLAFARQRQVSAVLLTWIVFVIVASAAAGFTGPRYRTPLEGMLICGAAVLAGGALRKPFRIAGLAAAAASLAIAAIVIPPYVASWRASVPYGLNGWTRGQGFEETFGRGATGFYAPAVNGAIRVELEGMPDMPPADLAARVEGVLVKTVHLTPGDSVTLHVPVGSRNIAFVELSPVGGSQSQLTGYYIRTPR